MGRSQVDGLGAATWVALLASLAGGCATLDTESESKQPTVAATPVAEAGTDAKLQACYATARSQEPELSVHVVALYFARDGKVVFADVELPESPELARCLADGMLGWQPIDGPLPAPPGEIVSGARLIDLGPPLTTPTRRPTLAEVRARQQRVTLAALRQGVLRESDDLVREMRSPPPAWPTPAMRAELAACHRDASPSHPGLVVHREVIYLTRGGKILLADVSIPEAPELQRCVLERISSWSAPFPNASAAVLSSFFIDLGGPEDFPDHAIDLPAELARRRALVERAVTLGLVPPDDPLRRQFAAPPLAAPPAASDVPKPQRAE
jgi:hypothetical protein